MIYKTIEYSIFLKKNFVENTPSSIFCLIKFMFGDTLRQFTTFKLSWWYCLPSGASQIDFISGFEVNEYRKAYFMIFLFEIFLAL